MSILPPPPHPRSSRPPPLLHRLAEHPRAELGEGDPALEEPTLVRLPRLYDIAEEDVEVTPVRHDYPPADLQAYRRSMPLIPSPPPDYSSWPPTVLETPPAGASWTSSVVSLCRTSAEQARTWWARGVWRLRWLARRGVATLAERWALIGEARRSWLRAQAPYALGLLVVLLTAVSLWPSRSTHGRARPDQGLQAAGRPSGAARSTTGPGALTSTKPSAVPVGPSNQRENATPAANAKAGRKPAPQLGSEATILLALAESLMDGGRDAEAVPVLERALARTAGVANDPTFLRIIKRGALSEDRVAATQIHALLIGPMGERGAEILYEISTSRTARKGVRERANSFVYTKDFEHKAPLPLYAAFKLLTAPTCEEKKSLLTFAGEAGGRHALDYLQELDEHKVCSLDDFDNCYPCMNTDDALPRAIEQIEKRLGN